MSGFGRRPASAGGGDGEGGSSGSAASSDPNQLIGPAGYAVENHVVDKGVFAYEILFENETTATNSTATASDTVASGPQRFYRVVLPDR